MWSTLCGAHQNVIGGSVFMDFPDHDVKCLYDYFNDLKYETLWFHGQSATYDSQGYFMNRHEVKHIQDRLSFPVDSMNKTHGYREKTCVDQSVPP